MGRIISSYIFPHPPIIVPEVGKGDENKALETVNACKMAARDIKSNRPDTIIITTPHGPVFEDYIYISTDNLLKGDLGRFGSPEVSMSFNNNTELMDTIVKKARDKGIYSGGLEDSIIKEYGVSKALDWGALVPLYYITKEYSDFKLVHISVANLPLEDLYKFGICISIAVEASDENVVFVASGDLSHRLTKEAPYGFSPKGREFDQLFINSIKNLEIKNLLDIDESLCEGAGECGLRSFIIMFGALDKYHLKPELYSYEGPFGIGYSVAKFTAGEKKAEMDILKEIEEKKRSKIAHIRSFEDPYVSLARTTLETYVRENKEPEPPENLPDEMYRNKAGVFVSIKKNGQLRGCIGTIEPTTENIAKEIIQNAISSGTHDPRFEPVQADELDSLVYSVDILKEPEPINSIEELDVEKYGVIVRLGRRSGLLLPNLEGVHTPEEQVSIALKKAGISPGSDYEMQRFEVVRHK